jgi:hypothetical protein
MNEPPLPSGDKQCFNCGKDLRNSATFCPHCGAPLPTQGSGIAIMLRFIMAFRIVGAIILIVLAFLFGITSAFSMIAGGLYGGVFFNPYGLVLVGVAALCIWGADILLKIR